MADLRTALTGAGLLDVRTYIQSGNAVARSRLGRSALQSLVHSVIAKKIGADIAVLARTYDQLERVMKRNPFPRAAASRTYFTLLESSPSTAILKEQLRMDFSPDEVKITDDAICTLYGTKFSDSKFNNNFYERKLKVIATTRNFNTMSRLLEMSK